MATTQLIYLERIVSSSTENFKSLPESVQSFIDRLIESNLVKKIFLFGSRARGDHRPNSDFDIAVEWVEGEEFRTQVLELKSLLNEQNMTLYKIDLLDLNTASEEYLKAIKNEGKLLWQKKD